MTQRTYPECGGNRIPRPGDGEDDVADEREEAPTALDYRAP
ncbi:hypothetical protein [Corynebacterium glyciniphilum]|nr:hypothetical protein [Corynebacterium glyciniphilum]